MSEKPEDWKVERTCPICDVKFTGSWMGAEGDLVKEKGYCFMCAFWTLKINALGNSKQVVVDNHLYYIGDPTPERYKGFVGFGGRGFKIKYHDGRIVETSNLWHNGEVPERFRKVFPNQAVFVYDYEESKSKAMADTLNDMAEGLFGRNRTEQIKKRRCVSCGGPAVTFTSYKSQREYPISGMCQSCQDSVFETE